MKTIFLSSTLNSKNHSGFTIGTAFIIFWRLLMKVIDVYNENKVKYSKYVILIKVGIFYETYHEDAYILNNLLGYKISDINGNKRLGFPVNSFNKVTEKLKKFKINYLIIDKEIIKKKFNKNSYDNFLNKDLPFDERINNISNRLKILKEKTNIDEILSKVEEVIW